MQKTLQVIKKQNFQFKRYPVKHFNDCIESIWMVETFTQEQEIFIPPTQFVDWLFIIKGDRYYYNNEIINYTRIEGIILKPILFRIPPETKILGIRLYGSGLYPFVQLEGKNIFNKNIKFSHNEAEKIFTELNSSPDEDKAISLIYELLTLLYDPVRNIKTLLVKNFYHFMKLDEPLPNINVFCQQNNTNYTTLCRSFNKILGMSPKKFERLLKFRKAIKYLINNPDQLIDVSITSGYFDQSHFIKEFKHYMNMTPSEYLQLLDNKGEHFALKRVDLQVI